jgi:hypothetical protein
MPVPTRGMLHGQRHQLSPTTARTMLGMSGVDGDIGPGTVCVVYDGIFEPATPRPSRLDPKISAGSESER